MYSMVNLRKFKVIKTQASSAFVLLVKWHDIWVFSGNKKLLYKSNINYSVNCKS